MNASLAHLPDNVLALVTQHLALRDLVNLVSLSGYGLLILKCAMGGVKNLTVRPEDYFFYVANSLSRILPLRQLTSLVIVCHADPNSRSTKIGSWVATLPPTLLELRLCGDFAALGALLRPVDPLTDDVVTRFAVAEEGFVPLNLSSLFPALRVLQVACIFLDCRLWTRPLLRRFYEGLPPSLTSLHLPVEFVTAYGTHRGRRRKSHLLLPPQEVLNNLLDFRLVGDRPLRLDDLLNTSVGAELDGALATDHLGELRFPFLHLESLDLPLTPTPNLALLYQLSQLRTLHLRYCIPTQHGAALTLPPQLTKLTLSHIGQSLLLSDLLRTVPNLLSFSLLVASTAQSCTLDYLPPALTELSMFTGCRAELRLTQTCELPTTLTRLALGEPSCSSPDLNLQSLAHLTVLQLQMPPELRNMIPPLPSSLTKLRIDNWLDPKILKNLPKTVTWLQCTSLFEALDQSAFEGLQTWSSSVVNERLRSYYAPWIPSGNFYLTVASSYGPDTKESAFDVRNFPLLTHLAPFTPGEPSLPTEVQYLPASLVEIRSPGLRFNAKSVEEEKAEEGDRVFPRVFSRTAAKQASYALPQTLRSLGLTAPSIVLDQDRGSIPSIWPLLDTAPHLEHLCLLNLHHDRLRALKHLPTTITRLELWLADPLSKIAARSVLDKLFASHDWLPNLAHLDVDFAFPLRCLIPQRIQQLATLQLDKMLVTSDVFAWPQFAKDEALGDFITLDATELHVHCLRYLIPQHLRSGIRSTVIEWNAESLAKLTSDPRIKTLVLLSHSVFDDWPASARCARPTSYEALNDAQEELASFLPRNLTSLDLGQFRPCLNPRLLQPSLLPSSITTLSIGFQSKSTTGEPVQETMKRLFSSLPNLTDLTLSFAGALDSSLAAALPRSLLRLALRLVWSVADDAFPALPEGLRYFSFAQEQPIYKALPKSLVTLVDHTSQTSPPSPDLSSLVRYNDCILK